MAKASIILSSYNHAEFLRESINSILEQSFSDFELIIVDDASTDDSWDIIQCYHDERIRAIRNPKNTNWGFFTKDFVNVLTGEYIAIAHDDDKWYPEKLGKQVSFLESHLDYGLCFTQVLVIDEKGQEIADHNNAFLKAFSQENHNRFEWLGYMAFNNCPFCHPSVLMRKELFNDPQMFPVALSAIPDYYKWIVAAFKHDIYILPEKLTGFRVRSREMNTSGDSFEKRNRQAYELWHALHLYTRITKADELIQIFPQAQKYAVEGKMLPSFALARIMIDQGNSPMHRQIGLDILYHLLENNAAEVEQLYGYTPKNYMEETGAQDIYGRIKSERFQESRLYIDYGQGFSDDIVLLKRNYIAETGEFYLTFDLDDISKDRLIKGLRFDPDKTLFRKYMITNILINDTPAAIKAEGSVKDGEWDAFFTIYAAYAITELPSNISRVIIEGRTMPISLYDVDMYHRGEVIFLQNNLAALCAEVKAQKQVIASLQDEVKGIHRQFGDLKNYLRSHRMKAAMKLIINKPVARK